MWQCVVFGRLRMRTSRSRWWYVILLVLIVSWLGLEVSQWLFRTRAERLLADIKSLQVDHSSWSDAQTLMFQWGKWGGWYPHIHLPLPCKPNPGDKASAEEDHGAVDSRHSSVRVKHHRPPARCWRVTSWSGRPRKTSEGRYRRSSPQRGHATVMD